MVKDIINGDDNSFSKEGGALVFLTFEEIDFIVSYFITLKKAERGIKKFNMLLEILAPGLIKKVENIRDSIFKKLKKTYNKEHWDIIEKTFDL